MDPENLGVRVQDFEWTGVKRLHRRHVKPEIQWQVKVEKMEWVEVSDSGMASGQCMLWSTSVKTLVKPLLDLRGSTRSR